MKQVVWLCIKTIIMKGENMISLLKNFKSKRIVSVLMMVFLILSSYCVGYAETGSGLSYAEKVKLYSEYTKIAEEASEEYSMPVFISPMDSFADAEWVSAEAYKAEMDSIIKSFKITSVISSENLSNAAARSAVSATKIVSALYMQNGTENTINISVTGSFNTQYSSSLDRQLFSGINSITAVKSSGNGTWTYDGYAKSLIDGGRTYHITVSGYVKIETVNFAALADTYFYCSGNGGVS